MQLVQEQQTRPAEQPRVRLPLSVVPVHARLVTDGWKGMVI